MGREWKGRTEKQTFLSFTVIAPRYAKQRDKNTVILHLGRSLLLVLVALSQAVRATTSSRQLCAHMHAPTYTGKGKI